MCRREEPAEAGSVAPEVQPAPVTTRAFLRPVTALVVGPLVALSAVGVVLGVIDVAWGHPHGHGHLAALEEAKAWFAANVPAGATAEEVCEGHGLTFEECDTLGCCFFADSMCWAVLSDAVCAAPEAPSSTRAPLSAWPTLPPSPTRASVASTSTLVNSSELAPASAWPTTPQPSTLAASSAPVWTFAQTSVSPTIAPSSTLGSPTVAQASHLGVQTTPEPNRHQDMEKHTPPVRFPFLIGQLPETLSQHDKWSSYFNKFVSVFGIPIFAEAGVPDWTVLHAAKVLAQFIDNDEDGQVDNPDVLARLHSRRANLVLFNAKEGNQYDSFIASGLSGHVLAASDIPLRLFPSETQGLRSLLRVSKGAAALGQLRGDTDGIFDRTLEQIAEFVFSEGYVLEYPDDFGISSELATSMNETIEAGYFRPSPGCSKSDDCQLAQYHMWSLLSILGAFDGSSAMASNGKSLCSNFEKSWALCDKAQVRHSAPEVYDLYDLDGENAFKLPSVLPDGTYAPNSIPGSDIMGVALEYLQQGVH